MTDFDRRSYLKLAGVTGAAGLTSLSGCTGGGSNGGGGDDTILFGATVSLTGSLSTNGKLTQQGYQLWKRHMNDKQGGIKVGDTTKKIELKIYDDESSDSTARTQYQKLVSQDNVDLLLGPYSSGMTRSVGPIAESNKIPMIAGGAASKEVYTNDWDYVYGTLPLANTYMDNVVKMADGLDSPPKRVGIIHVNTLFPTGVGKGAEAAVKEAKNLQFVFRESYPEGTSDLSSIINKAKSQNIDLLIGGTHTQSAILAMKQMKSLKFNPKMVAFSVGPPTPDFRESLGDAAEHVLGVTMWLPEMSYQGPYIGSAAKYNELFKEEFGSEPDYHAASTATDGLVFQHAIEQQGSAAAEDVEKGLNSITTDDPLETFYGPVGFSTGQLGTRGANLAKGAGVLQIQSGKPKLVYPGGTDVQYPMPTWSER
ncbi:MAG: amino acid ABC transporter substrate-binding protein [Halanaeroarchaeum sp.]